MFVGKKNVTCEWSSGLITFLYRSYTPDCCVVKLFESRLFYLDDIFNIKLIIAKFVRLDFCVNIL